jgi:23S rRNA pseudouridine1911/1915/1917 synthase
VRDDNELQMGERRKDQRVIELAVGDDDPPSRLDQILTRTVPELSRSAAARLIRSGLVEVDEAVILRPSETVRAGSTIRVRLEPPAPTEVEAQEIPLKIVWQDGDLAIIDKPAGLVVHPASGHADGTLVNALLHHLEDLSGIGGELRPGIVHRLDKETSGLLVVAKNDEAHRRLSERWRTPEVRKIYVALVYGTPDPAEGRIDRPIGRHPKDRKKMAVVPGGREARTRYRTLERFHGSSLLEIELETGRTHQIRVHLASIGHPVVGDPVYGGAQWKGVQGGRVRALLRSLDRQALHASRLELVHPRSGDGMVFESPLPEDMRSVVEGLRSSSS